MNTEQLSSSTERRAEFSEHAHRYAELGWPLVRVIGKRPKDADWQKAVADEPNQAAGKWGRWGDRYNLGVVLGGGSLAVLEYDSEDARERFRELLGDKLPDTPVCRTGSGRLHVYFADPGGVDKGARDGLELRAGAHQCLIPPSIHPDTGKPYEWLEGHAPWEVALAGLPSEVRSYFARPNGNGASPVVAMIPKGERNATLTSLAGTMRRRGMSESEILPALLEINRRRCDPPLSEAEVAGIAKSVVRYPPQAVDDVSARADAEIEAAFAKARDPQTERPPFVIEVMTARALCLLPEPPGSDELLGPLLMRAQRLILGAHTGEGKTTMALRIVRAVVLGETFLDWRGAGGRALVIDAEQGLKTIKRRLREAGLEDSELVDYVRLPDGLQLNSNERQVAEVERVLGEGEYAIVCADPLYKLHTGDSNAEREAVDLMRRFDAWREQYGFGLVLPIHCRKPVPGTRFSIHDLFGSSAYTRGAEVVLGLQRVGEGYSKLHWLKDRDGDLPVATSWGLLFSTEEGYRRDPNDGTRETATDKVRALLAEDPGLSNAQLVSLVGFTERTVRRARTEIERELQPESLELEKGA